MLTRLLIGTAAGGIAGARQHMRYDEFREHVRRHFQTMLADFKEKIAVDVPPPEHAQETLRVSQRLGRADVMAFASYPLTTMVRRASCAPF
jgi:hypothetical protein